MLNYSVLINHIHAILIIKLNKLYQHQILKSFSKYQMEILTSNLPNTILPLILIDFLFFLYHFIFLLLDQ